MTASLITVSALGWLLFSRHQPAVVRSPWPFVAVVALFLAGETFYIELPRPGGTGLTFVMSAVALAVCCVLGHPTQLIPAHALALTIRLLALRRVPSVKLLYNIGQVGVGDLVAFGAFRLFHPVHVLSWRTAAGAVLATIVAGLCSVLLVTLALQFSGSKADRSQTLSNLAISAATSATDGVFAVEALFLGAVNPLLIPLSVLPLLVLRFAYRDVKVQQLTTDRADFLYQATVALHQEKNLDEGLLGVLDRTRKIINSDSARVVMLVGDGTVTCGSTKGLTGQRPMTAAPQIVEDATRNLVGSLDGATLVPRGSNSPLAGPLSVFGSGDTIIAPLIRDDERAGIVMVSRAPDALDRFLESDVDLVDVLARQIGLALEKGFLERSLHQLIELEGQLRYQAFHDGLTGLANRTRFNKELRTLMAEQRSAPLAVLLLDVDDFKMVNDSFGHGTGDRLLEAVAQRVTAAVGDAGLTSRLGGDEFAILLYEASLETAVGVATTILTQVNQPVVLDVREVSVGASIGIAMSDGAPEEPADVLRNADLALYRAKGTGKGRFAVYEESMHIQVRERLELSAALTNAVERGELVVAYQPIHDLWTGDLVGVEALVRWRHPELGELLPGQFLAMTEETGQIVEIGQHVLKTALATAARWERLLHGRPFSISVNVSGRQLREERFESDVLALVRDAALQTVRLTLEITESVFISDAERAAVTLHRLSASGIRLSLDDFGTGYSSLSQLHRFPMDQVKIDRSFVSRLVDGPDEATMVNAILQLARALRMDTVAEGIETTDQLTELRRLGCRRGQGWLLGRPQSADHIEELLLGTQSSSIWASSR
jgi:diguanylate cyclase (GGDEF)-like protein